MKRAEKKQFFKLRSFIKISVFLSILGLISYATIAESSMFGLTIGKPLSPVQEAASLLLFGACLVGLTQPKKVDITSSK